MENSGLVKKIKNFISENYIFLSFAFFFLYQFIFFNRGIYLLDEGNLYMSASKILDGQIPYRDFFEYVTPGSDYVMALVFGVFGKTFLTARVFGILNIFILAVLSYLIAIKFVPKKYAAVAILIYSIFGLSQWRSPWFTTLALVPALSAIYFFLYFIEKRRMIYLIFSSVFIGLSVLFKQNIGPFLFIASFSYLLIEGFVAVRSENIKSVIFKNIITFLAFSFLPIIVFLVYLNYHGAVDEFFYYNFKYAAEVRLNGPASYFSPVIRFLKTLIPFGLVVATALVSVSIFYKFVFKKYEENRIKVFKYLTAIMFLIFFGLVFLKFPIVLRYLMPEFLYQAMIWLLIIAFVVSIKNFMSQKSFAGLSYLVVSFGLILYGSVLSGFGLVRYTYLMPIFVIVLMVVWFEFISSQIWFNGWTEQFKKYLFFSCMFFIIIWGIFSGYDSSAGFTVMERLSQNKYEIKNSTVSKWIYTDQKTAENLSDLNKYINEIIPKDEKIFIYPSESLIYFLNSRISPTYFSIFDSSMVPQAKQESIIKELAQSNIKHIIFHKKTRTNQDPCSPSSDLKEISVYYPEICKFIFENYEEAYNIGDYYSIMKLK